MTISIPNPRRPGDDIEIHTALDLHIVKPVSAKGRKWFKRNTGSIAPQLLVGDLVETLADSFAKLNLQVVWNPPSDTSEIRKIVSDRLAKWRIRQVH